MTATVRPFPTRRLAPPFEERAVWCLTCRECIKVGLPPMVEVSDCAKCADLVLPWRVVLGWCAVSIVLWAIAGGIAWWIAK